MLGAGHGLLLWWSPRLPGRAVVSVRGRGWGVVCAPPGLPAGRAPGARVGRGYARDARCLGCGRERVCSTGVVVPPGVVGAAGYGSRIERGRG